MRVGKRAGRVLTRSTSDKREPVARPSIEMGGRSSTMDRSQVWQGEQLKPAILPKGSVEGEIRVLTWVSVAVSCTWGQTTRGGARHGEATDTVSGIGEGQDEGN